MLTYMVAGVATAAGAFPPPDFDRPLRDLDFELAAPLAAGPQARVGGRIEL